MPPRGSRTSSRARLTNRSDQRTERADSVALLVCSDTDHLTTLVIGTVNLEQTVKKGEDLTSDNYVGKPDEPETTEGTVTDQPKEEEQLQSALKSAGRGYENAVVMRSNVTLTDNLTIPSGVCLRMNGCTLNASIYKINLEHEAAINVESQSKLYVGAKNIVLGNDENDFCYGEIGLYPGCEFKYGDALFTAENKDGDDGWTGWISMEKRKEEFRDDRDPNGFRENSYPNI